MCTLNDQDYDNELEDDHSTSDIESNAIPSGKLCKKCGEEDIPIVQTGQYTQCDKCFLTSMRHKFKATLGKSKMIRRGNKVLIAHSGKANSTALLLLLKEDADDVVRKKLLLQPKIIYIDDGAVKERQMEGREHILCSVVKEVQELALTEDSRNPILVSLRHCLSKNFSTDVKVDLAANTLLRNVDDDSLLKIFNELGDDTAKDDLLRRLRRKLLVTVARKLGCDKVFLADTSTNLAIKVLTDISTGRGGRLSADVGFSDSRCPDVTLVRPLKDFTAADVSRYLDIKGVTAIVLDNPGRVLTFPGSIRNLAGRFVYGLDKDFHSTVSTIHRTSEKLLDKTAATNCESARHFTCILCDAILDCSPLSGLNNELSAVQATFFSKQISSSPSSLLPTSTARSPSSSNETDSARQDCRCGIELCAKSDGPLTLPLEELRKYLCYGCALIFSCSENNTNIELPSFIVNAIQERIRITRMREEVTEFLL